MTTLRGPEGPTRHDIELETGGMTCASCANRIERKLNKLDGVVATVSYASEKAKVAIAGDRPDIQPDVLGRPPTCTPPETSPALAPAGRVEHWSHARAQGVHAARAIAHRAGLAADPGPFRATPSYATRLHGRPVSVIGQVTAGQREVLLAAAENPAMRVTVRVDDGDRIGAAVVLGAPKIAKRLQPLVAFAAPLGDGDNVVARISA